MLLLVFFGTVVYAAFFSDFLVVSSISIKGNDEISKEDFIREINKNISGKYLGVINKNNLLFLKSAGIESGFSEKFKKIKSIHVKKVFPSALDISIVERETKLTLSSGEKNFLIDESGKAYDEICSGCARSDTPVLRDSSGIAFNLNEDVLEKNYIEYVEKIRKGVGDNLGIEKPQYFETPSLVSGDIRAITQEGWKIYFDIEVSPEKELEMLKIFLEEKLGNGERVKLEYVDLRADNKIFYKFKGEEQNGTEISQEKTENDQDRAEVKGLDTKKNDSRKDKKKK